jgi:hypothetical protein
MADPNHPEHAEMCEWYGRPFDPKAFSLARATALLRRMA